MSESQKGEINMPELQKGKSNITEPQKVASNMVHPKRTGLKVGARTEFLVIGDVIPGQESVLRRLLYGRR
jgi:hypothetical protein